MKLPPVDPQNDALRQKNRGLMLLKWSSVSLGF